MTITLEQPGTLPYPCLSLDISHEVDSDGGPLTAAQSPASALSEADKIIALDLAKQGSVEPEVFDDSKELELDGKHMPEMVVTLRALERYESVFTPLKRVAHEASLAQAANVKTIATLACAHLVNEDFTSVPKLPEDTYVFAAELPTIEFSAACTRLLPLDDSPTMAVALRRYMKLEDIDLQTSELPLSEMDDPHCSPRRASISPGCSDETMPIYGEQYLEDLLLTQRLKDETRDLHVVPLTWLQRRVAKAALRKHTRVVENDYEKALAISALVEQSPPGLAWAEKVLAYAGLVAAWAKAHISKNLQEYPDIFLPDLN